MRSSNHFRPHASTWRAIAVSAALLSLSCGSPTKEGEVFPQAERTRATTNQVLEFDGKDDYASTGTAEFPHSRDPHTLSLWVNVRSLAGKQAFVTMRRDLDAGTELGVAEGRVTAFRIYDGSAAVTAPDPLTIDTWTHVAYSFDGTTHALYIDGTQVATGELEPNNRTPTSCWLGSFDGYSDFLNGSLDDVRLDSGVRSAEELAAEARGESTDPENVVDGGTRLVALWDFDEAGGLFAFDDSGHGNDATLGDGVEAAMPTRISAR
jgi:hypothetical protein